jgi:hypothetical protein
MRLKKKEKIPRLKKEMLLIFIFLKKAARNETYILPHANIHIFLRF